MSGPCDFSHGSIEPSKKSIFFFNTISVVNLLLCWTLIQITFLVEITPLTLHA